MEDVDASAQYQIGVAPEAFGKTSVEGRRLLFSEQAFPSLRTDL